MGEHLYRILTDEWQGDWRRKKTHIQKLQRQTQCWSLMSMFSHSGILFFSPFSHDCANSYTHPSFIHVYPLLVPLPVSSPYCFSYQCRYSFSYCSLSRSVFLTFYCRPCFPFSSHSLLLFAFLSIDCLPSPQP